jgi:hypothetical protein
MRQSPEEAVEAIRCWFAELPPQEIARSVSVRLPNGSAAPSADTLVTLSRLAAEGPSVVIELDDWLRLRFEHLASVERVSEGLLELSGFGELLVSWHAPDAPPSRRYTDGAVRFVSNHAIEAGAQPLAGAHWENPI